MAIYGDFNFVRWNFLFQIIITILQIGLTVLFIHVLYLAIRVLRLDDRYLEYWCEALGLPRERKRYGFDE